MKIALIIFSCLLLNFIQAQNIGIGIPNPSEKLQVQGIVHTTQGGVRFPDGSLQTTAASNYHTFNAIDDRPYEIYGDFGAITPNVGPNFSGWLNIASLHFVQNKNQGACPFFESLVFTKPLDQFSLPFIDVNTNGVIISPASILIVENINNVKRDVILYSFENLVVSDLSLSTISESNGNFKIGECITLTPGGKFSVTQWSYNPDGSLNAKTSSDFCTGN